MLNPRICLGVLFFTTVGCNILVDKITGRNSEPAASAEVPAASAAATPSPSPGSVTVTGPNGQVVQVNGAGGMANVTVTGSKGTVSLTSGATDAGTFAHVSGPKGGLTATSTDAGTHVTFGGQTVDVQKDSKGGSSVSIGGKTITLPPGLPK